MSSPHSSAIVFVAQSHLTGDSAALPDVVISPQNVDLLNWAVVGPIFHATIVLHIWAVVPLIDCQAQTCLFCDERRAPFSKHVCSLITSCALL